MAAPLEPGYHARVRPVRHPYINTPVAFLTEIYYVPPMAWWARMLMRLGCLRFFEPKRVYHRRFDLPGMPLEVEQAYVRHNLDLQLGKSPKPRWWIEEEHSIEYILLSDQQLFGAMRTWKLVVGRLQEQAGSHVDEVLQDFRAAGRKR